MVSQLLPVTALLFGSALLLFGGGIHGLILAVRGSAEGFSAGALGLLGTGWAIGYVLGCLFAPRLVGAVGHVRAFGALCAFAGVSILLQALAVTPEVWIPVRALSGFCFAGAAMIVESWLNDRAQPSTRGRIFAIYSMVNLSAATLGQLVISLGDISDFTFFAIGAIFYCLALAPTALSTSAHPAPLTSVKLDPGALWRNSPIAVAAVFLVGISNASFGALSAVYADRIGLELTSITLFASIPILAGALGQIPFGFLSDRLDRRIVLVGAAVLALAADLAFIMLAPTDRNANLALSVIFGMAVFAMYPIIVAHANDHAPPGTSIQVSGGLLLVFGLGSIGGPLIAGVAMSLVGPSGLFMTTVSAHVVLILFALWRISRRSAPETVKTSFHVAVPIRAVTPETAVLAEGEEEALPLVVEPEPALHEAKKVSSPDTSEPDDSDSTDR